MKSTTSPAAGHFIIPSLDGLRTLSILLVFISHAGVRWVPGGFGVTVFFFLSGYLITTLLRMEHERTGGANLRLFYLRRVIRIWPPFYLVWLGGLALVGLGVLDGPLDASSVAAQAMHVWNYRVVLHGWSGVVDGSGVYWSLAVEEHFYLLFPALFILLNRLQLPGKRQAQVFWALCAVLLAWRYLLVSGGEASVERTFVATDTRMDSILFGCALAVFRNPVLDAQPQERPAMGDYLALAAGSIALLVTFLVRADFFRETLRYSIQGVALYPLFSAAVRFPEWGPFRLLNLRSMRFVGTLSYSIYLVHYTVLKGLTHYHETLSLPARLLLGFALSFAISYAIWRFVEKPCAALRKSLSRGAPKPAVALREVGTG